MRLVLLLFILTPLLAAPLERDLGQGLRYHRVHALPGDLPPANPAGRHSWVLDLRFVPADSAAATAVQGWLRFSAGPRTPVFVLVNRETSGELIRILNELYSTPGLLTIGVELPLFQPDVAVRTTVEDERRAYDAVASGTPVAEVLNVHPDKARNDEASLSRDRLAEASAALAAEQAGDKRARPPIDAGLQRAVHLHRSLLALKKI